MKLFLNLWQKLLVSNYAAASSLSLVLKSSRTFALFVYSDLLYGVQTAGIHSHIRNIITVMWAHCTRYKVHLCKKDLDAASRTKPWCVTVWNSKLTCVFIFYFCGEIRIRQSQQPSILIHAVWKFEDETESVRLSPSTWWKTHVSSAGFCPACEQPICHTELPPLLPPSSPHSSRHNSIDSLQNILKGKRPSTWPSLIPGDGDRCEGLLNNIRLLILLILILTILTGYNPFYIQFQNLYINNSNKDYKKNSRYTSKCVSRCWGI